MQPEKEKAKARNYRDLIVWQDAIKLAKAVYILLQKLPKQEMYALNDQIRRAVVSVPSISQKVKHGGRLRSSAVFFTLPLARWQR